jgi:phage terminase large subunit-like protein
LESNPDAAHSIRHKLESATDDQILDVFYDWHGTWARTKQLPPDGDWTTWVVRAGRAWGKTLAGSQWIHQRALEHPRWIALVARTPADARDYMVEGPSGFLRTTHPRERPIYEPSKRRLTWPNKSWATIYSDEEPDQLRGFSGDTAWIDEFAKFQNAEGSWHNLQFGMRERSSDRPRTLITTTPRPLTVIKEIEAMPLW